MISTQLLKYPEQLAAKLTQMEKDIKSLKLEMERLKKGGD